jgi:two-component system response regulator
MQAQSPTIPILIVEDSLSDYESIMRAFRKMEMRNPVFHCETGSDALDFLSGQKAAAPRPGIILLDLNLPGIDGRDVLKAVKGDSNLKSIPVIILTTSEAENDINDCYFYGANSYMTKASTWEQFFSNLKYFRDFFLEAAHLPLVS